MNKKLSKEQIFLNHLFNTRYERAQREDAKIQFDDVINYIYTAKGVSDELGLELNVDFGRIENTSLATFGQSDYNNKVLSDIHYIKARFQVRIDSKKDTHTTLVYYSKDDKEEILNLLNKIEKIINAEITPQNKKSELLSKLSKLRDAVNQDSTSLEKLFITLKEVTKAIGESAENLIPLKKLFNAVQDRIICNSNQKELLENNSLKGIENKVSEEKTNEDDTPF